MLPKITNDGVSFHLSDVSFPNACAPIIFRLNFHTKFEFQISVSTTSKRNAIIENAKNQNAHINSMILNSQDKNIHDTYEGYYKDSGTISAGAEKILCEIKVEPFKVTDHHEKNYYKGKFKHPSEFK